MIVVTGANGQLGTAFRSLIPDGCFIDLDELDLTAIDTIRPVMEDLSPSAIINCAAYTAVDAAETNDRLAHVVNESAVGELARTAEHLDVPFVTFSTDYVFDGTGVVPYVESDPTAPINVYGRSKLAGEIEALAYERALVIRTSWLVSGTHPNFVATMIRLARQQSLRVIDDQRGCPTIADDLAAATINAVDNGSTGLLHLTNQGPTTWFDLAVAAVAEAGLDAEIEPCATDEFPTPAARPAYSVMGSERLAELGLDPLPHWRDSLPRVVRSIVDWL